MNVREYTLHVCIYMQNWNLLQQKSGLYDSLQAHKCT